MWVLKMLNNNFVDEFVNILVLTIYFYQNLTIAKSTTTTNICENQQKHTQKLRTE